MPIVNQYLKAPKKTTLHLYEYVTLVFCISTFSMVAFRGLIFHFYGAASVLIWIWMVISLIFVIRISSLTLGSSIIEPLIYKYGLHSFVHSKYLYLIVIILTASVILNLLFSFLPFS